MVPRRLQGCQAQEIWMKFGSISVPPPDKKWQKSVEVNKQSNKGSADQLSTVMDTIGRKDQNPALVLRRNPAGRTWPFRKFQNQLATFSGQKSIIMFLLGFFQLFFWILVSLGLVEQDHRSCCLPANHRTLPSRRRPKPF